MICEPGVSLLLLVAHELHGRVAKLKCMIDRSHSGLRRIKRARFASGMYGHTLPEARRLAYGGHHFLRSELERRRETATYQRVLTRFVDLNEIGAFLELLANRGHEFSRVVGLRGVGEHALLRIVADGILVPAENVDGVAADA
jgi:hypothetical protein